MYFFGPIKRFRRFLFVLGCFSTFLLIFSIVRDNRDDIITYWNNYYYQQSIFLNIVFYLGQGQSHIEIPNLIESNQLLNSDIGENGKSWSNNWTAVQGRRLILYSAYVDENDYAEKIVRVLAYKHCHEHRPVHCIFEYYADDKTSDMEISPYQAEYEHINHPIDNGDCSQYDKYEPFYVNCRRTIERRQTNPTFVYIIPVANDIINPKQFTSNGMSAKLKIFNDPYQLSKTNLPRYKLIMCVKPLYDFRDERQLKLFLEYYLYQGAEYFLIYYRSSSRSVKALLDEYRKKNLVQLIDWPTMPKLSDHDDPNVSVHFVGQILSMNDCLWRVRHKTIYAGLVDTDELVVPLSVDSSKHMMTVLEIIRQSDNVKIGGFGFRHSYAYVNWPYHNDKNISEYNFEKLNVRLTKNIHPFVDRSKVFVKPKAVHKQSVHLVWKFVDGFRNLVMSPHNQALLYHIRSSNEVLTLSDDKSLKSDDSLLKNILKKVFESNNKSSK